MNRREEILARVRAIDRIPAAVEEVVTMLGDPQADYGRLSEVIETDPGLTLNILRLANTPLFGGVAQIESVRQAVVQLGADRVLQMAIAIGIAPRAVKPVRGYGLEQGELLRHSLAVGVGAEALAKELGITPPTHTFTAGLLVNIGKMVMGEFLELDEEAIIAMAHEEMVPFEEAEQRILGISHSEVGAVLLKYWGIPESIITVVRYHLRPEDYPQDDMALNLVHMGDIIARMTGIGLGLDGMAIAPSVVVAGRLNLTAEAMENVMIHVAEETDGMYNLFAGED